MAQDIYYFYASASMPPCFYAFYALKVLQNFYHFLLKIRVIYSGNTRCMAKSLLEGDIKILKYLGRSKLPGRRKRPSLLSFGKTKGIILLFEKNVHFMGIYG